MDCQGSTSDGVTPTGAEERRDLREEPDREETGNMEDSWTGTEKKAPTLGVKKGSVVRKYHLNNGDM